jgi:prepilin signal peptidase PulO-like enzyme (type II secretory pathway)
MLEVSIVILIGLIAGVLVNVLADELPYRRNPAAPVFPDGTPRPIVAWSGIIAFLTGNRAPQISQPDDGRARTHVKTNQLSWRYPLTELFTIFLMLLALQAIQNHGITEPLQIFFLFVYMAVMALIVVIDIEHKLILFVVIIPTIIIALADSILTSNIGPNLQNAIAGGLLGFFAFYLAYQGGFLFNRIAGKMRGQAINTTAFGYGDVMMITLSGVLLGFAHVFVAMFITVFLGAFGAIIYLLSRKLLSGKYNAFTALPYGPYIVAATIIMIFYGDAVQFMIWGF